MFAGDDGDRRLGGGRSCAPISEGRDGAEERSASMRIRAGAATGEMAQYRDCDCDGYSESVGVIARRVLQRQRTGQRKRNLARFGVSIRVAKLLRKAWTAAKANT